MSDNLIYSYPDQPEEFEKFFKNDVKQRKNKNKIFGVFTVGILLFFLCYCIPAFEKIDWIFLLIAVILAVIFYFYARQTAKNSILTLLSINAVNDKMTLTYYSGKTKKVLQIYYDDIESARFSDDSYTKFQIAFVENKRSFIKEFDMDGKETVPLNKNLFLFSIRPMSYEQYFFLYVAEYLFTIKGFYKTKKFFKRFGHEQEYIEKLESESE